MSNPDQSPQYPALPRTLIESAPKTIYLDLGQDYLPDGTTFDEFDDLTWSNDNATGHGIAYVRADLAPTEAAAMAATVPSLDREALTDLIAEHLRGTYHCDRVWEAWRVGTMREGDFSPVEESDTPAELADEIIAKLASQAPVAGQPAPRIAFTKEWCMAAAQAEEEAQADFSVGVAGQPAEPSPADLGRAPRSNLPGWSECKLRVENSDFIAKRVAEGGYGADHEALLATELHRFIYEYDDADACKSEWFRHRLEKLLQEIKAAAQPAELVSAMSVTLPLETAMLIRNVFLPANVRKMRSAAEETKAAAYEFIGAVEMASRAAAEARNATLTDDAARDRADAVRWRVLRSERETSLIIMHFGNGCINRTIEEVETIIDARAAASISTKGDGHG